MKHKAFGCRSFLHCIASRATPLTTPTPTPLTQKNKSNSQAISGEPLARTVNSP